METRREAGDSKKALLKDKKGLRQRKEKDKHKRKRSTRLHFPPLRWELKIFFFPCLSEVNKIFLY